MEAKMAKTKVTFTLILYAMADNMLYCLIYCQHFLH